ncbi:hypothetical protein E4K67_28380 [Desulfosporosinus fructosivorans]|uniref:Uncharacterized protein n=1 Tax=Desulfosporosinus fructosivorans TaxID=2018669 RepID=A0A4Z0QVL3_9FIRM|nr:hypothetical protein [Desulfosporosinus fructosivorans]TGE34852.1 hypothetical protein E4K67_28380 [Desulfosporosinus fructosivorans]
MNFENIAKLVHELVKSPNRCAVIIPQAESIREITSCEMDAIVNVFWKEELSGMSLAARLSPTRFWV